MTRFSDIRASLLATTTLVVLVSCGQHRRVPPLPTGFWRLSGDELARRALSRGDSGLVVLFFPDSSSLAVKRDINLQMDPERDFYHLVYGDLGIDTISLSRCHDSIVTFLDAYNWRMLSTRFGLDPEELEQIIKRGRERALQRKH